MIFFERTSWLVLTADHPFLPEPSFEPLRESRHLLRSGLRNLGRERGLDRAEFRFQGPELRRGKRRGLDPQG